MDLDYVCQDAAAKGTVKKWFGIVSVVQVRSLIVSCAAIPIASRMV
jgi:hypothetical protein